MLQEVLNIIEAYARPLSDSEKEAFDAICKNRPQMVPFLHKYGALNLDEYGKHSVASITSLSDNLKNLIVQRINSLFGESDAKLEIENLSHTSSIDTSGHGGIFSEDTLLQSHGVISQGFRHSGSPAFVSFACGVVPMNNATWPRGYFILGARESIFPKSFDRIAFHECPAFTREMVDKKLTDKGTSPRSRAVLEFIKTVPGVFDRKMYFEQTSLVNHLLWEQFVSIKGKIPSFFQLMLEDITSELVIHSIEKEDALSKLIFCSEKQPLLFEMLGNLPGTWSPDRSKGTYLFWQSSGDFRAASLWLENGELTSLNSKFSKPFNPETILAALRKREIVPSVFLSLITLLHNGVRPLGGYHQLYYLPEYRKRITEFMETASSIACPNFLEHIQCINLFNLGYGFSFLHDPEEKNVLAGIDTFMNFPESREKFLALMGKTTVASGLISNLKRLHAEIVPKEKGDGHH